MIGFDGPTLRAIRESLGVPLRRIARQVGMSHGHLSKVERGEYGRPVTPAIVAAYERVTGVKLADAVAAVGHGDAPGRPGRSWRPGQLSEFRRRGYNAAVAALAIGGQLGEPYARLLDATGRPLTPAPPRPPEVAQLEQLGELVTALDLRYGGGLVSQLAKVLLRWAVAMLDSTTSSSGDSGVGDSGDGGGGGGPGRRLHAAIAALAARAGWAAFDMAAHEAARSLFRLALYTAARAGDANLRAHVLADVAAQHNQLGYHDDCLQIVRIAEGDERVAPPVRMVLHGVKARAYAAIGHPAACRRHIEQAEQAYTDTAEPDEPTWVTRLRHPGHLYAATGHALAQLHHTTTANATPATGPGSTTGDTTAATGTTGADAAAEAAQRLTRAIDAFDPATHARARALCNAQLATVQLATGELDQAEHHARQALTTAAGTRSARLDQHLATLHQAAATHPDQPALAELVNDLSSIDHRPLENSC